MFSLSRQIRERLFDREMTQTVLANQVHRSPARISELLRSLDKDVRKQDRLGLLQDIAEVLQMEIVLIPRDKSDQVMQALGDSGDAAMSLDPASRSIFDELFIDLGADDDLDEGSR